MKKSILTAVVLTALTATAFSQPKTLFSMGDLRFSGFGGPSLRGTQIAGEPGMLVGGYGGVMLNQTFIFGGGGYGLVNNIKAADAVQAANPTRTQYIRMGYGGFYMEYVHNPMELVHFSASTLIGGGGAMYSHDYKDVDEDNGNPFFVVEPAIHAELNMTDFLRTNVGLSYRWVNGLELDHLSNKDLSQVTLSLNFKFGWFGPGSYSGSEPDEED